MRGWQVRCTRVSFLPAVASTVVELASKVSAVVASKSVSLLHAVVIVIVCVDGVTVAAEAKAEAAEEAVGALVAASAVAKIDCDEGRTFSALSLFRSMTSAIVVAVVVVLVGSCCGGFCVAVEAFIVCNLSVCVVVGLVVVVVVIVVVVAGMSSVPTLVVSTDISFVCGPRFTGFSISCLEALSSVFVVLVVVVAAALTVVVIVSAVAAACCLLTLAATVVIGAVVVVVVSSAFVAVVVRSTTTSLAFSIFSVISSSSLAACACRFILFSLSLSCCCCFCCCWC